MKRRRLLVETKTKRADEEEKWAICIYIHEDPTTASNQGALMKRVGMNNSDDHRGTGG